MVLLRSFGAACLFVLAATTAANACSPTHSVVRGDTLWEIASDEMGSGWNYPQIFESNRDVIRNPNLIYIGDELDIPCKTGVLGEIDWSIMPTAEAFQLISDAVKVQVVDIRSSKAVADGTLPGAISVPFDKWRGGAENPGLPRTEAEYEQLIGAAGIRLDMPTLIVHAKDTPMSTGAGAYVYWLMKSLGGQELAILRGGFEAWEAADGEIAAKPAKPRPYTVDLAFDDTWRASEGDVWQVASQRAPGVLLDARPHNVYNKLDSLGKAIATTIPGARNLPAPPLMSALSVEFDIQDGVETVIDHYRGKDALGHEGDIITFCHSGTMSALNWFYASELASIENVRLYPESLVGWNQSFGVLAVGEG
ncbi:MAG: rhodanese-like domain-containing protein [Pseudomonadota bacterium]